MTEMKVAFQREEIDLREKGSPRNGQPQATDRRLYFQLLCFSGCYDMGSLAGELKARNLEGVLYKDMNDPYGIGVLLMSEDPVYFTQEAREFYAGSLFKTLAPKPELTMLGKTYSNGREPDLEDWLLKKPRRNVLNPAWPWAIWYPLRRKPEFAALSKEDQSRILMEHAVLGRNYGMADLAHDIRLSCYGIDKNDNEFVIGLVSADLHALSRLVQDMRKTEQTSKYIQSLGPFFVGRAAWQSMPRND